MRFIAVSSRLCALLFSFSASFVIDSVPFVPFPNANDPKTLARRPPEPEDPFLPAPADDAPPNALFDRGFGTPPSDFVERSDGFAVVLAFDELFPLDPLGLPPEDRSPRDPLEPPPLTPETPDAVLYPLRLLARLVLRPNSIGSFDFSLEPGAEASPNEDGPCAFAAL